MEPVEPVEPVEPERPDRVACPPDIPSRGQVAGVLHSPARTRVPRARAAVVLPPAVREACPPVIPNLVRAAAARRLRARQVEPLRQAKAQAETRSSPEGPGWPGRPGLLEAEA